MIARLTAARDPFSMSMAIPAASCFLRSSVVASIDISRVAGGDDGAFAYPGAVPSSHLVTPSTESESK